MEGGRSPERITVSPRPEGERFFPGCLKALPFGSRRNGEGVGAPLISSPWMPPQSDELSDPGAVQLYADFLFRPRRRRLRDARYCARFADRARGIPGDLRPSADAAKG